MRVYEFLEANLLNDKDYLDYAQFLQRNFGVNSVSKFYSLPFELEMISDLFQEIKHIRNIWYDFRNYPYPETLNDFIRNCQKVKIELKWKVNNGK